MNTTPQPKRGTFARNAESQIRPEEAVALLETALADPNYRHSRRLVRGRQSGREEMLGQWVLETPKGTLHQVAIVRVIDGEAVGFDCDYMDEADADAVYAHLSAEIDSPSDDKCEHDDEAGQT